MAEGSRSAKGTTKPTAKKAAARPAPRADKADGESAVLATIAAMPEPDRVLGERLHAIVTASAPALSPRLWYGMPAYAKDGKVVCFFQSAQKFKTRYATFGFMHEANLDDGAMWPTAFALKELTAAEEARIGALVTKAVAEDGRGCSGELPGGRSDGRRAGNPARLAPPVRPAAHRLLHGLAVRRRSGARPVGAT